VYLKLRCNFEALLLFDNNTLFMNGAQNERETEIFAVVTAVFDDECCYPVHVRSIFLPHRHESTWSS
jgi:hypothetical protein